MNQEQLLRWANLPAAQLNEQATLAADWNRLNATRGGLVILDAASVGAALRHFSSGSERLLVARAGARCVAMFVMVPAGSLRWQTFQPSQLPLGAWTAESGFPLAQLTESLLASNALGLCAMVSVTQVDPHLNPRESDTGPHLHGDYIETAWVPLEGSFDDYWAARGKNLRQNMRKQANKLQAEGISATARTWSTPEDMPAAVARYGELEKLGWKAKQGTAIAPDNAQGRFYTELLSVLARHGEAQVCEYLFDDRVVASNLCVQRGSTLVILKTTYDESLQGFSPAFLLQMDMLQRFFEGRQIERVEYYGRVMEWHTRWTDSKRTLYHLTSFRHRWLARLAAFRRQRQLRATEEMPSTSTAPPKTYKLLRFPFPS